MASSVKVLVAAAMWNFLPIFSAAAVHSCFAYRFLGCACFLLLGGGCGAASLGWPFGVAALQVPEVVGLVDVWGVAVRFVFPTAALFVVHAMSTSRRLSAALSHRGHHRLGLHLGPSLLCGLW
jgi:hypothetical protein